MLRNIVHWIIKAVVLATCKINVEGIDKIPKNGGCIIASNHLGRMDVILGYYIIKRKDIILTIAEKYYKILLFRITARALDAIFIDRYKVDYRALRQVLKRLNNGGIMVIAPEGTRSKTESLIEGKPGAAYLAIKTNVPIIPVALTGTEDRVVIERLSKWKRPQLTVTIGDPILAHQDPKLNRSEAIKQLTEEIMCQIALMLPSKYHGVYGEHPRLMELLTAK
ncbi:MAG: 1-acyl-sn-glycerol-3-phosphate acyltransferase [Anaerolineales bacterium]|nr:1-acyl-sn-glycerol-3-phosphate acyltransferase [Anaerolineales bacterium]